MAGEMTHEHKRPAPPPSPPIEPEVQTSAPAQTPIVPRTQIPPEEVEARLAELRKASDLREAAEIEQRKRRELAILELEDRLTRELGRRGEDFEIIDGGPVGPLAVRLGEGVTWKRYRAKVRADEDTQEDMIAFVSACMAYPDAATFREACNSRPFLWDRCADQLIKLFGAWEGKKKGKA
jgi:hypothetical protein